MNLNHPLMLSDLSGGLEPHRFGLEPWQHRRLRDREYQRWGQARGYGAVIGGHELVFIVAGDWRAEGEMHAHICLDGEEIYSADTTANEFIREARRRVLEIAFYEYRDGGGGSSKDLPPAPSTGRALLPPSSLEARHAHARTIAPPYETRAQLREATLAVGRRSK